jgi:hypothetical protein
MIGLGNTQLAGVENSVVVNATVSFTGVSYGIPSSPEDLAILLVFHYLSNDETDSRGLLISNVRRLRRETEDAALSAALWALGTLSCHTKRSPHELIKGRRQYGEAVPLTSGALRNPAASKITNVLVTVILLAVLR